MNRRQTGGVRSGSSGRIISTLFVAVLAFSCTGMVDAQSNDRDHQVSEVSLRRGFRDIQLGISFGVAQEALRNDVAFGYRGPEDVSLRLSDREAVIDSPGRGFVSRVLLQFHQDRLYIIAMYLNQNRLSYFDMYRQLEGRYGPPADLSPEFAVWQDQRTRISLERPLRVQFLDLETFEQLRSGSAVDRAVETEMREDFLNEF